MPGLVTADLGFPAFKEPTLLTSQEDRKGKDLSRSSHLIILGFYEGGREPSQYSDLSQILGWT